EDRGEEIDFEEHESRGGDEGDASGCSARSAEDAGWAARCDRLLAASMQLEVPGDGNGSDLGRLQTVDTGDYAIGKIPRGRQVGQSLQLGRNGDEFFVEIVLDHGFLTSSLTGLVRESFMVFRSFFARNNSGKGKRGCGMRDAGCGERRAFSAHRIPHPASPLPASLISGPPNTAAIPAARGGCTSSPCQAGASRFPRSRRTSNPRRGAG